MTLLMAFQAHALGRLRFGPEFTFCDLETAGSEKFSKTVQIMTNHLVHGQPEGAKFKVEKRIFSSPNGWWFEWMQEGANEKIGIVMEIKMFPAPAEYFRRFKDDMQDAIFASAANAGLFPALFRGGGHINISSSAFDTDLFLRNFLVDLMNHNELFMGVFGYDTNNALPFALIPKSSEIAVRKVIRDFDNGAYKKLGRNKFVSDLEAARATETDPFLKMWGKVKTVRAKHFDFNLGHLQEQRRLELRGVRPQASMDVWLRQIELLEARLKYLDGIKWPIPIKLEVPVEPIDLKNHRLNPPVDPQKALQAFYRYVSESGREWKDHTDYLWPKWITDGEVAKFEKSEWFKFRERKKCEQALSLRAS